jgi:hypothetical protein
MLKIFTLVAVCVFGLAGTFMLALMAWNEAKQYALARQAMRRIAGKVSREPFVISRKSSRNRNDDSFHAA